MFYRGTVKRSLKELQIESITKRNTTLSFSGDLPIYIIGQTKKIEFIPLLGKL